jgi:hypothetical protein
MAQVVRPMLLAAMGNLECTEHEDCREEAEEGIAELCQQPDGEWARTVDGVLFTMHLEVLERRSWPNGWQPADLARVASRELGAPARRCMVDLMAAQLRTYAPTTIDQVWHDQLGELGARVWWTTDADYVKELMSSRSMTRIDAVRLLLRLLGLLNTLPAVGMLTPPPGKADSTAPATRDGAKRRTAGAVDAKMLARVRALLAKAESTTFEAEAETFTTAAQAMMARHSIDEAMLHRHQEGGEDDKPGGVRLAVENPYPEAKALLLQKIAEANRCRAVWTKHLGFSTVLGYRADTAWVELLYTSLLVQATSAMAKAGTKTTRYGTSRTRAFRSSFLESFAQRIGERLSETTRQAETEAAEASGPDLLPVLVDRGKAVDEEMHRRFPDTIQGYRKSWTTADSEGWGAGRAAADLANLARGRAVGASGRS